MSPRGTKPPLVENHCANTIVTFLTAVSHIIHVCVTFHPHTVPCTQQTHRCLLNETVQSKAHRYTLLGNRMHPTTDFIIRNFIACNRIARRLDAEDDTIYLVPIFSIALTVLNNGHMLFLFYSAQQSYDRLGN